MATTRPVTIDHYISVYKARADNAPDTDNGKWSRVEQYLLEELKFARLLLQRMEQDGMCEGSWTKYMVKALEEMQKDSDKLMLELKW